MQEARATIVINSIITIVCKIKFITKKGKSTLHSTKQNRNHDTRKYTCYTKDNPRGGGLSLILLLSFFYIIAIIITIFFISIIVVIISIIIVVEGKRARQTD